MEQWNILWLYSLEQNNTIEKWLFWELDKMYCLQVGTYKKIGTNVNCKAKKYVNLLNINIDMALVTT